MPAPALCARATRCLLCAGREASRFSYVLSLFFCGGRKTCPFVSPASMHRTPCTTSRLSAVSPSSVSRCPPSSRTAALSCEQGVGPRSSSNGEHHGPRIGVAESIQFGEGLNPPRPWSARPVALLTPSKIQKKKLTSSTATTTKTWNIK